MNKDRILPAHYDGPTRQAQLSFNSYLEVLSALNAKISDCFKSRHDESFGSYWRVRTKQYIAAYREVREAK